MMPILKEWHYKLEENKNVWIDTKPLIYNNVNKQILLKKNISKKKD